MGEDNKDLKQSPGQSQELVNSEDLRRLIEFNQELKNDLQTVLEVIAPILPLIPAAAGDDNGKGPNIAGLLLKMPKLLKALDQNESFNNAAQNLGPVLEKYNLLAIDEKG